MKRNSQNELLGVLHEMAEDLHEIGAISDERMKEYDKNCLVPGVESAPKSKAVEGYSQELQSPAPI